MKLDTSHTLCLWLGVVLALIGARIGLALGHVL